MGYVIHLRSFLIECASFELQMGACCLWGFLEHGLRGRVLKVYGASYSACIEMVWGLCHFGLPPASFLIRAVSGGQGLSTVCLHLGCVYNRFRGMSGLSRTTDSMSIRIPEGLLDHSLRGVGRHPRVSDSGGLGWCLTLCVSDKFPGDAEAARPETTL